MSRRPKTKAGAMLELWRPPNGAGDPVGCIATTFTFAPGLFDEQCLARFLEIESEPDREDLAFLLERESRLGAVYAGILVDHTQAGVEHSLRWDVLPVRIEGAKQHAKLSVLAWTSHVRLIVASANLTEQGYRSNYEIAGTVDLTPEAGNLDALRDSLDFLRALLRLVPGASQSLPTVQRADEFLNRVRFQTRNWSPDRGRSRVRQSIVCTLPSSGPSKSDGRSSLDETIRLCRNRGGSPEQAWVASPFFDGDVHAREVTSTLGKSLARGTRRQLHFCVPAVRGEAAMNPRLAAPRALLETARRYVDDVVIELLPDRDADGNMRPWHAKMITFKGRGYNGFMAGSSNFTTAGLGVGVRRNVEANLVTLVDEVECARESGALDSIWPEMEQVEDPDAAEWLGRCPDREEEEQAADCPVPAGFLSAVFRAGTSSEIVLHLDPNLLPAVWVVAASGRDGRTVLSSDDWEQAGRHSATVTPWSLPEPPEKLLVRWDEREGLLPLNVEDPHQLPPPSQLENMSADDMLGILAAADPSGAYRAWAKKQKSGAGPFDDDLDSATPVDLDPLRRFDLQATFLHRIRRRARVLAQMRANLQRPVWGRQTLEWRLRGLVGIEAVADRLVRDVCTSNGHADESLLVLADFLIVLHEVDYKPTDGAMSTDEFNAVFQPFLRGLARKLAKDLESETHRLGDHPKSFWNRVVKRCLG